MQPLTQTVLWHRSSSMEMAHQPGLPACPASMCGSATMGGATAARLMTCTVSPRHRQIYQGTEAELFWSFDWLFLCCMPACAANSFLWSHSVSLHGSVVTPCKGSDTCMACLQPKGVL